jgi:sugar O-acyltransferase (sialic acid O-acetyltransferase NeuD family)
MLRPLVLLGATGNAHDIVDVVEAINARTPTWHVVGVLDDSRPPGTCHLGLPVLGPLEKASGMAGCAFINAIGSDRSFRQRPGLIARLGLSCERFATLVHPLASVSSRSSLGVGVCVNFGVSLAGGVSAGDHVYLGAGCIVGHDTVVGDHSVLAPAAVLSGFVHVGPACYIGTSAAVRGRVRIGEGALVGMGTVVLRDVDAETTVVGNPARVLRRRRPDNSGVSPERDARAREMPLPV